MPASRIVFAALWLVSGIVAAGVSFALGQSKNLEVFRFASLDLLRGGDLYRGASVDFFKYSPTFAFLFTPLAKVPSCVAAVTWGALNFGVAFAGLDAVVEKRDRKPAAFAVALAGVLFATDGDQSNLLLGGSMLLAVAALQRGRPLVFALLVALSIHVKLFPIAITLFAFLHPRPWRTLAYVALATLALAVLPLIAIDPRTLLGEYGSWIRLLSADHANRGWCVMTMLEDLTKHRFSASFFQVAGALALVTPLVVVVAARSNASASWLRLFVASILAFSVLFNHRAEYATYVLSALGVGLWYAERGNHPLRRVLVAFAIVAHGPFLVLSDPAHGGIFSFLTAHRIFHPLRVVPLFLVWSCISFDLLRAALACGRSEPDARPSIPSGPSS